jgi:transposase
MIPTLSGAPPAEGRVLIATRPVDFHRGADGLAATVQSVLRRNPFSGTIFVFRSKRADRVKMLVYDGTGLVLIWKRLEGAKFKWPAISDGVMRNRRRCSRDSIGGGCMPQGLDGRRWPAKPPPSGLCVMLTHLEVEDRTAPAA